MGSLIINNRIISVENPPLVIVEIGINHEGSLKIAMEMVDAAYNAGAELIKHQTHVINDEMSQTAKDVIPGNSKDSIYEIMKRCTLSEFEEIELKRYVESKGMIFISTPFSKAAADRLNRMGITAFKIGSGEMNNHPLIRHIASFGKPMIISTGMNDIESVKETVKIIEGYNVPYALMHTTNLYPTRSEQVRLGAMQELMREFPDSVVGLSDHTINNNACLAAVALGASIVERHFTDSKDRSGPDIVCSMTPEELTSLIQGSNEIYKMRGGSKKPLEEEQVTIDFAFSTVVTIKDLKKGDTLNESNIWVKRPRTGGISAKEYHLLMGRIINKDIKSDIHLTWDDVS
jgi:N-acetylneuraminate synthase